MFAENSGARLHQMVLEANGFAQVMPKDKNDVVRVLQALNYVVGMTGDGVNDAPALKQAHIGIAVEGSTDAARNAADIVLTAPGLSAIYAAVYESRLIFRRVRSYVLYRVAATVQIVVVLCALIFGWDAELNPLYVVLLALFNDVTITPIAHDRSTPSPRPEVHVHRVRVGERLALAARLVQRHQLLDVGALERVQARTRARGGHTCAWSGL